MPKSPEGKAKSPAKQGGGAAKPSLFLGIDQSEVKKKPTYFDIPKTLTKMLAPASKAQQWFDFMPGSYYPISITNNAGELLKTNRMVSMEISYHNDMYKPVEPQLIGPIKPKNGIYWFSILKSFVFGDIQLKFSVRADGGEEVADYVERIVIDRDENGNENTEVVDLSDEEEEEGAEEKKSSKKKKSKKKKSEDAMVINFDDIEAEEEAEPPPEKKKASQKKKRAESFASDGKGVEMEEPNPSKKRAKKGKATSTVALVPDRIMPESVVIPIAARHRLFRSPLHDAETGKSEKVVVEGSTLSITMPISLTSVLLDDECKVKTDFVLLREGKLAEQDVGEEDTDTFYYNRPSANQLFLRLTSKMSHVLDANSIINQLRMLFEYSFEDWVLFKEEKELHKTRIASIKSRREKFGDHFGAYYYLRFFVFYTMLGDMPEGQGEGSSRGNDRQYKALFAKAQEVVNYAIRDMDESAPKYFA